MAQPFAVSPVEGVVTRAPRDASITVECPSRRQAFHFIDRAEREVPLAVGDWVCLSGTVRVETVLKKDGMPKGWEGMVYFHPPHDGTPSSEWLFFELYEAKCEKLGPASVLGLMRAAEERLRSAVQMDPGALAEAAEVLERAAQALRALASDRRAEVRALPSLEDLMAEPGQPQT